MPNFDAPQSPIEAILQNMLGANNVLRGPQSRNEALLLQILDAMQHGGGAVSSVNGQTGAVVLDADDVGAAPAETVVAVSGTTPTITPADNTVYKCGELTSLTVSSFPASGKFWIWFTSGSTPTTTVGIANFAAESNKKYRITVEDGYATYDAWSLGGGE